MSESWWRGVWPSGVFSLHRSPVASRKWREPQPPHLVILPRAYASTLPSPTTPRPDTRHDTSIAKMGARRVSSPDDLDTEVSYQGFVDELLPDEALVYLLPLDYGVDSAPQLTPALAPAGLPALEQNSSVTTSFADMATQEVSSSVNTHISHQALAGEAFAYFLPLDNEVDSTPQLPPALPSAGLSAPGPNSSVTTAPYTSSYAAVPPLLCPAIPPGLQLPAQQFFPAAPAQQPPPSPTQTPSQQ